MRHRPGTTTDPLVTSPPPWRSDAVLWDPRSHRNRKWSNSGVAPCCSDASVNAEVPGVAEGTDSARFCPGSRKS